MTCRYCGSRIGDFDERCGLCGRKPDDSLTSLTGVQGALATQPRAVEMDQAAAPPKLAKRPSGIVTPIQRQLFQEVAESNVIPFPPGSRGRKAARSQPGAKSGTRQGYSRKSSVPEGQARLDFYPAVTDKRRVLDTTVEAKICCEAPVAARMHRAIAAGLDWTVVLIGYGALLLAFRMAGGEFFLNKTNGVLFASLFALTAFAYGALCVIAGAESLGMRWTGLRLLTFDGFQPEARQRVYRLAGACLSVCTAVGMLWPLGDEERLALTDHVSGTFPTPIAAEKNRFGRH